MKYKSKILHINKNYLLKALITTLQSDSLMASHGNDNNQYKEVNLRQATAMVTTSTKKLTYGKPRQR